MNHPVYLNIIVKRIKMFPKSDNLLFPLKVGLVFLSINFLFFF